MLKIHEVVPFAWPVPPGHSFMSRPVFFGSVPVHVQSDADALYGMSGININWPFSQLILAGVKTVEVRSYALGYRNVAQPDVEMWLVETPGPFRGSSLAALGSALLGDTVCGSQPQIAHIVGTVTFSTSHKYKHIREFHADEERHRIVRGSRYDWRGCDQRYAWSVSATRRLTETIPQPGPKGVTGFRVPRSYHARFADGFGESRG